MEPVTVSGRFLYEGDRQPVSGSIKFIPSRLWVDVDEKSYAVLAPDVELFDGWFEVQLTRTDAGNHPWYYTVETPLGKFKPIRILNDGPLLLKNLLPNQGTEQKA